MNLSSSGAAVSTDEIEIKSDVFYEAIGKGYTNWDSAQARREVAELMNTFYQQLNQMNVDDAGEFSTNLIGEVNANPELSNDPIKTFKDAIAQIEKGTLQNIGQLERTFVAKILKCNIMLVDNNNIANSAKLDMSAMKKDGIIPPSSSNSTLFLHLDACGTPNADIETVYLNCSPIEYNIIENNETLLSDYFASTNNTDPLPLRNSALYKISQRQQITDNELLLVADSIPKINNYPALISNSLRDSSQLGTITATATKIFEQNFSAFITLIETCNNLSSQEKLEFALIPHEGIYKEVLEKFQNRFPEFVQEEDEAMKRISSCADNRTNFLRKDLLAQMLKTENARIAAQNTQVAVGAPAPLTLRDFITLISTTWTKKQLAANIQAVYTANNAKISPKELEQLTINIKRDALAEIFSEEHDIIPILANHLEARLRRQTASTDQPSSKINEYILANNKSAITKDIETLLTETGYDLADIPPGGIERLAAKLMRRADDNPLSSLAEGTGPFPLPNNNLTSYRLVIHLRALNLPLNELCQQFERHARKYLSDNLGLKDTEIDTYFQSPTANFLRQYLIVEKFLDRENEGSANPDVEENLTDILLKLTVDELDSIIIRPSVDGAAIRAYTNEANIEKTANLISKVLGLEGTRKLSLVPPSDPAFRNSLTRNLRHISNIATTIRENNADHLNAYFYDALPIETLQKIVQENATNAKTASIYASLLANAGNLSADDTIQTNLNNIKNTLVENNEALLGSVPFLNNRVNANTIKTAAEAALSRRRNPTIDAFIPYSSDNTNILAAALDKRNQLRNTGHLTGIQLPMGDYRDISEVKWSNLYNARNAEEMQTALSAIGISPPPIVSLAASAAAKFGRALPNSMFNSEAEYNQFVQDLLARRQHALLCDRINNPALAAVFKKFYGSIKMTSEQVLLANEFIKKASEDWSLGNALTGNNDIHRSKFLDEIECSQSRNSGNSWGLLHDALQDAAPAIQLDHWHYLQAQERNKSLLEANQKKRASHTKTIQEEKDSASAEVKNFHHKTFVTERMERFLLRKGLAPNGKSYNLEMITDQWLKIHATVSPLVPEGNNYTSRIARFNDYMQTNYGTSPTTPFMVLNDYLIIDRGYSLQTEMVAGNLAGQVKKIREKMDEKLGKLDQKDVQDADWKKLLPDIDNDNYDRELDQKLAASETGTGIAGHQWAKEHEEVTHAKIEQYSRIILGMTIEKQTIEALKKQLDDCKLNYPPITTKDKEQFTLLQNELDIRAKRMQKYRGENDANYSTYKGWIKTLKEIQNNINTTLYHDPDAATKRLRKADELLIKGGSAREERYSSREEWQKTKLHETDELPRTGFSTGISAPKTELDIGQVSVVRTKLSPTTKTRFDRVLERQTNKWVSRTEYISPQEYEYNGKTYSWDPNSPNTHKMVEEKTTVNGVEKTISIPKVFIPGTDGKPSTFSGASGVWVKITLKDKVPFNDQDSGLQAKLAMEAWLSVKNLIMKSLTTPPGRLPDARNPIICDAYDSLSREYLEAAFSLFQATIPELKSGFYAFDQNSAVPKRSVSLACPACQGKWAAPVEADIGKTDNTSKTYFNEEGTSDAMWEFLNHVGYPSKTPGVFSTVASGLYGQIDECKKLIRGINTSRQLSTVDNSSARKEKTWEAKAAADAFDRASPTTIAELHNEEAIPVTFSPK